MGYHFNKKEGYVDTFGFTLSQFNKCVSILNSLLNDDFKELKKSIKINKENSQSFEEGPNGFVTDHMLCGLKDINKELLILCKRFCTEGTYRINKIEDPKDQIFKYTKVYIENDCIYISCIKTNKYGRWLEKNIRG